MQKRTIATRSRLMTAAEDLIASKGYGALRVEDVVQRAGVAKGTFFAHFRDKDALMDLIIGTRIGIHLDEMSGLPAPETPGELTARLMPLMEFMTCERYVFDVILRHSGAAAKEDIGAIAQTFTRQVEVIGQWLSVGPFRKDVPPLLLAEGVQAFAVHCMALHFCAVHSGEPMHRQLEAFLNAWLSPPHRAVA